MLCISSGEVDTYSGISPVGISLFLNTLASYRNQTMIVVTGAAGFIGSCLVRKLNDAGYNDIAAVDDFSKHNKNLNLNGKMLSALIHRDDFFKWLKENQKMVQFVFHLGARTDTTESDTLIFEKLNLSYSKEIWKACVEYGLPLVYASSAATYGSGENGYDDGHSHIPSLKPLNPYGVSKQEFDKWVLVQERTPYFWAGLKFFNVYGPSESHKGRMASVVYHAYKQIMAKAELDLFRSHNPAYRDGEQKRDFIYVKDVLDVCVFLMLKRKGSGIYNLGTGRARTFLDLAKITFASMGLDPKINFIDTPADIRDKYQYFTEARMDKLRGSGYDNPFFSLEEGIRDYVQNYLLLGRWM